MSPPLLISGTVHPLGKKGSVIGRSVLCLYRIEVSLRRDSSRERAQEVPGFTGEIKFLVLKL